MTCKRNCSCKSKEKTAIIFGVTGQDGSHLADLLLKKKYKVIGVARRSSTDNTQRISHINNPNFKIVDGDITDYSSIVSVFAKNATYGTEIYNLAAQSHVAVSFKQPGLTWDVTGKGCLNLLQAIVDLNLDKHKVKFYQASSSEMYGKSYDVFKGDPYSKVIKYQDENTKFMPQSPYAIAKCAAHHMTRLFRESYGVHASAGILFNHEGPRRGEDFVTRKITKWIGEYTKWKNTLNPTDDPMVQGLPESDYIYGPNNSRFPKLRLGNLEAFRDWGYAGDYVEAMWMMLQKDSPDDYVICTGETHTIREFLDAAFKMVGINTWDHLIVQDPAFYRPAEVDYLRGDSSKARTKLGWTPKTSFEGLVNIMMSHDVAHFPSEVQKYVECR
jgi:GDPmannose 4,6-dehydratase